MEKSADLSEIQKQRRINLENLKNEGIDPYGARFDATHAVRQIRNNFIEGEKVVVAGRLTAYRAHGKTIFADVKDSGERIQLYIGKNEDQADAFELFKKIDLGDWVGIEGELFKTRTDEMTIRVQKATLLAKNLAPLPEKWHGLKDIETRYRQRYLDLIANDEVREIFLKRSGVIATIRKFLDERGYLEVETPMMHPIAGGAAGNPFVTHHEALDMDLFLRIAPEIYLKKLLVGGLLKVYEINRSFRNEGISVRHNPEFTMLEVYTAFGDCAQTMRLAKELLIDVADKVFGKRVFDYQGKTIDFNTWQTVSFADIVRDGYGILPEDDLATWAGKLRAKGVKIKGDHVSKTQIINIIADLVEPESKGYPVFVVDIFSALCPLAKTKKDNPLLSDRFELFIGGMEVANAYSELNDPIEQRRRFEEQLEDNDGVIDEDFIRALEYGMPPAGGLGIGIDRVVMLLTNSASIRDVILFPQLKKEA